MPEKKRPKEDIANFIITQAELARMSAEMLRRGKKEYGITGKRARALAMQVSGVDVHIETRDGPMPERCPCCSADLEKHYEKNLSGKKFVVSLKCKKCNYIGSKNNWAPKRYGFRMK